MTLKKFAELFENLLKESKDAQADLEDLVSYISTQNIKLGEYKYVCIKINERILSRKYKTVRTELAFWQKDDSEGETYVVSIDSTVNNLKKTKLKFKNFRNITYREETVEDEIKIYLVAEFEERFPMYNNLLAMGFRARDERGNIIGEYREMGDIVSMDEVKEIGIAL